MTVNESLAFVLRHAEAGERSAWTRPDRERPLTSLGWKQSRALVERLGGIDFKRLISSPYLRCLQTLQPLAEARGMAIEIDDELAEDGRPEDVENSVVDAALAGSIIACVHGNGMTRLMESLAERGVPLDSDPSNCSEDLPESEGVAGELGYVARSRRFWANLPSRFRRF